MRIAVAVLLICAGAPIFCQTSGQTSVGPGESGTKSPEVFQLQNGVGKGSAAWQIVRLPTLTLPPGAGEFRMPTTPADPKMIVRPPQASIGVQPPGTQVAQNLYPGLKFMPIEQATVKVEPIPIVLPNAKMEKIPTTWTEFKMSPIQNGTDVPAAK
jgi:hypothetical protein